MIVNTTCVSGNDTSTCSASGSPAGLAVGLTLFFLLLVILAIAIMYKYHSQFRSMLQFGHRRSQRKGDNTGTPEADSRQYPTLCREQSIGQAPIYENLTSRAPEYSRHTVNQSRLPSQPEEDMYLQCEFPDDAIYSNDLACNHSILSDSKEEDLYIMPDS